MAVKFSLKVAFFSLVIGLAGCERPVSFSNDVQPILVKHCAECHQQNGEGAAASGFDVSDYESVMRGTKFGPVVVPGSSISSSLYLLIAKKTAPEIQMPPRHEESLSAGQGISLPEYNVETIRIWIDQGAKDN